MVGRKGKKQGAKEEDNNVNADGIPAHSREKVQRLKEIFVNLSEQELYAALVKWNLNVHYTAEKLTQETSTEQGTSNQLANSSTTGLQRSQEVESNQGEQKETKDTSESCSDQGVDSSVQNNGLGNSGDHDVGQGGENKLNSNETSTEPGTSNQLANSSTTGRLVPYKNDLTNVEIEKVPKSSAKTVPVVRGPSRKITSGGTTMAGFVKRALGSSSKESVTNPSANSVTNSDAARDQPGESASVYDYEWPDNAPVNFAARTDQLQESASEPNHQMQNLYTFFDDILQLPHTRETDPLDSTFPYSQSMPTRQSIPTASSLGPRPSISMTEAFRNSTIFVPQRNEQDGNRYNYQPQVHSGQYGAMMNSRNWRPNQHDSNIMPPSPAFPQQGGSSNSTRHHQSQDSVFHQYGNSNLPQSASPSAHGSACGSMMNSRNLGPNQNESNIMPPSPAFPQQGGSSNSTRHHQSQDSVFHQYGNSNLPQSASPSAHGSAFGSTFGSMMNSRNLGPNQNESNIMPPSPAFPQQGGSSNSTRHHQSQDSVFHQYGNSNLPQSASPSAHGSAFGSTLGSVNDFIAWSGNAANTNFGYEDVSSNHLLPFQRQGTNSDMWRPQGEDRVTPVHWGGWPPSSRHSQQGQQPSRGTGYERRSAYYISQNQQNNESDTSDQTQQQQRRRDNH